MANDWNPPGVSLTPCTVVSKRSVCHRLDVQKLFFSYNCGKITKTVGCFLTLFFIIFVKQVIAVGFFLLVSSQGVGLVLVMMIIS